MTRRIIIAFCIMFLFMGIMPLCDAIDGIAFIAVKSSAVGGLGHVGVGFQNSDGTFTCGAIENTGGSPLVIGFLDNGGWVESDKTMPEVAVLFNALGYDGIKVIQVNNVDIEKAIKIINNFPKRGYAIGANDCLSATEDVLKAYGVDSLPLRIAHIAPKNFYENVKGEGYTWDDSKKRYINANGVSLINSQNTQPSAANAAGQNLSNGYANELSTGQCTAYPKPNQLSGSAFPPDWQTPSAMKTSGLEGWGKHPKGWGVSQAYVNAHPEIYGGLSQEYINAHPEIYGSSSPSYPQSGSNSGSSGHSSIPTSNDQSNPNDLTPEQQRAIQDAIDNMSPIGEDDHYESTVPQFAQCYDGGCYDANGNRID